MFPKALKTFQTFSPSDRSGPIFFPNKLVGCPLPVHNPNCFHRKLLGHCYIEKL